MICPGGPNIIIIESPTGAAITPPIIGRPCESTAVPVMRAVRVGISAMFRSLITWPMPIVTRCASAILAVPGKYVAAYPERSSLSPIIPMKLRSVAVR